MTAKIPKIQSAWVLTDGKAGDELQCIGIAGALGLEAEIRRVSPRAPWTWFMPRGPIDPRDAPDKSGSPLSPPWPDLAIASGRRAVPYMRTLKRASGGATFTVFLKDPRAGLSSADFIWAPEHDSLRGPNVMTTLTSPHTIRPEILQAARENPPPEIAALKSPRIAIILGGNDKRRTFSAKDIAALMEAAASILQTGASIMVTPSRRTPPELIEEIRKLASAAPHGRQSAFVWDGNGDNPYRAILACADAILVTGDSVNMIGEAAATGAPVHVFEPSGSAGKLEKFIDGLIARGAVRRWRGKLEVWHYQPIDATDAIAAEIRKRFEAFRQKQSTL